MRAGFRDASELTISYSTKGPPFLELVQSDPAGGVYGRQQGEGLHHIGFHDPDVQGRLDHLKREHGLMLEGARLGNRDAGLHGTRLKIVAERGRARLYDWLASFESPPAFDYSGHRGRDRATSVKECGGLIAVLRHVSLKGHMIHIEEGATVVNSDVLYAHLIHREAERIPDICHYPMLDTLSTARLLVGPDGRRFCDEKVGGIASANRIAHLDDPASTWLVLDRRFWETAGHENQIVAPNPNLPLAGARIEVAEDISELAWRTGISEEPLRQTVETAGLRLSPPYLAIPVAVGLTFTMGGPLVDEHARVLGATGPIAGLYAVGGAASGLSGGPKPAYAAGIAIAVTLCLLAAEHAASA